jgi:hypothetical protein
MKILSFLFSILFFQVVLFAQTGKTMIGTWYYYEPAFNKIMSSNTEYTSYVFLNDGKVVSRSISGHTTGTYKVILEGIKILLTFDYGNDEIRTETWKIEGNGRARIVYRTNERENIGFEDDLLYIKENTKDWQKQKKSKELADEELRFPNGPTNLKIGKIYLLEKNIPLAPEIHPANPAKAMSQIKTIYAGSKITITKSIVDDDIVWYGIKGFNTITNKVETGWIKSTALMGQKLKEVKD